MGVGWFFMGTMEYELTAPCVIRAGQSRHVAAPYDARIISTSAKAGDLVHVGDVLCQLDRAELDLKRAELHSELDLVEQQRLAALADQRLVEAQLAMAKTGLLNARTALIDRRIEQATVTSPIDGMIVSGDLQKRLNGLVSRGEPLFEVAPADTWTLEIMVAESASSQLAAELNGRFASLARPEETYVFSILRVRPQTELHRERTVFVAEADIQMSGGWIRSGMEGVAKIQMGRRRVCWLAFHGIVDYLRLNFWL